MTKTVCASSIKLCSFQQYRFLYRTTLTADRQQLEVSAGALTPLSSQSCQNHRVTAGWSAPSRPAGHCCVSLHGSTTVVLYVMTGVATNRATDDYLRSLWLSVVDSFVQLGLHHSSRHVAQPSYTPAHPAGSAQRVRAGFADGRQCTTTASCRSAAPNCGSRT